MGQLARVGFDRLLPDALTTIQRDLSILFPAHLRTVKRIAGFGFAERLAAAPNLRIVAPLGYLEFLGLMIHACLVLTDSGGIQEETTILGIPCLTLRDAKRTERPITIVEGTNTLIGADPARIVAETRRILDGEGKTGRVPELWDGHAAERIVKILRQGIGVE